MKSLLYVFVALSLLAGLFFSPAISAPAAAAAACGDTYTVLRGDFLSKIANNCGVSLSTLISNNPEIKDINRIFPGQVIRIKSSGTIPVTGSDTYTVVRGDYLSLIAQRFGTTVSDLLTLNPDIKNPSILFVGQVIKLPGGLTTGLISLSTRSAKVGAQVEVKVTGFPASADIDFRLGKEGAAYSAVVDGKTDSKGAATAKVTIPSTAKVGEKWVVKVLTTSLASGKDATSLTITITN
jgi:LysM repeat protein